MTVLNLLAAANKCSYLSKTPSELLRQISGARIALDDDTANPGFCHVARLGFSMIYFRPQISRSTFADKNTFSFKFLNGNFP